MQSRRAFLATVGATGSYLTAGCSSRDAARIEQIAVISILDEAVTVDLRVARDDKQQFAETFELGPDSGSSSDPAPVVDEPWLDTPGQYRLTVDVSTTDEQFAERLPNDGSGCYDVTVQVRRPDLVLFPVDSAADGCATDTV